MSGNLFGEESISWALEINYAEFASFFRGNQLIYDFAIAESID